MTASKIVKLAVVWQKTILAELGRQHPEFSQQTQQQIAIRLIIKILALHYYDANEHGDRKAVTAPLRTIRDQPNAYLQLQLLWQRCLGMLQISGLDLPFHLQLKDVLIRSILDSLFYPDPNQFRSLPIAVLGQVYEALLASDSSIGQVIANPHKPNLKPSPKKIGGIYYTPEPIVQSMVRSAIHQYSLSRSAHVLPTVLDPACGGGAFLLKAYQALIERRSQTQLVDQIALNAPLQLVDDRPQQPTWQDRLDCLQKIYGLDVDPQAIAIAQLSLSLIFLEDTWDDNLTDNNGQYQKNEAMNLLVATLSHNLRCGNALIDMDFGQLSLDQQSSTHPFNWQIAFPEIFAEGGFEIVIGNPPYIDAEWMTAHLPNWRSYCATHYRTATGNWDLFCVFIEKTLQLCRAQGCVSLIVPNKLLSADYAQAARLLLAQYHVVCIQDYAQVPIFEASVYPLVYLVEKLLSSTDAITLYQRMQSIDQIAETYPIRLAATSAFWGVETQGQTQLMQHLEQFPKLGELMQVVGAATVTEAYLLKDWLRNQPDPQLTDLRVINSGTIDRFLLLWGRKPCRYLGQFYSHPVIDRGQLQQISDRRLTQATQPKIIVAGMAQKLECTIDLTGNILAGKSTSVILEKASNSAPLDLRYLLGLLNSHLLTHYFRLRFGGNRLQSNYFRIGPPQLRQLPIVLPNLECSTELQIYQTLIDCVEQQLIAVQNPSEQILSQQLDMQIDRLVYQLYQIQEEWLCPDS